jgi:outer membrane protein assembly factor BamB
VYVQAGGGFVKLDKVTGKVLWRVMADGGGMNGSAFSSPFFTTLGGVPQILVQGREELAGIDPEQGTILWKTPVEAFRGMNIVTPTVSEGKIFTTSYGGGSYLFAVDPPAAAEAAEKNFAYPVSIVFSHFTETITSIQQIRFLYGYSGDFCENSTCLVEDFNGEWKILEI